MNLNDLKVFEAVAQKGSFTDAAKAMFTVQSNVTARIKALEEVFGVELFDRSQRKIMLTPAGQKLLKYSKQINLLISEAQKDLNSQNIVAETLQIGCIETTLVLKAAEIILKFQEKKPYVQLNFKAAMRDELIADVLSSHLDAAFISGPIHSTELNYLHVKKEKLVIVTSDKVKDLKISHALPVKTVIFDHGCVFRATLESWLSAHGFVHYTRTVLSSLEGIINFVEAGLGITVLPEELIRKLYPDRKIRTFPLGSELNTMHTILITRKDTRISSTLKALLDCAMEIL